MVRQAQHDTECVFTYSTDKQIPYLSPSPFDRTSFLIQ